MPKIHPGATLTPHFRDFLPPWLARQPWYRGSGEPALRPVGFFRFEDPAGEVGIETHLVMDGSVLYQVPMTYRGAPMAGGPLIAVAEHSVLGRRWIYDAVADPAWTAEALRLVGTEGTAGRGGGAGIGDTEVHGRRLDGAGAEITARASVIELMRVLTPGEPPDPEPGLLGAVLGSWQPQGSAGPTESGCLAVIRAVAGGGP